MVGVIFIFIFFGQARHLEYLPYIVLGAGGWRDFFFYGCIFSDFFLRFSFRNWAGFDETG